MNKVQLSFRMKDSDDTETEGDNLNAEETHPTRDEIIAEIRRIRYEVKVYPALSDFKERSEYDTEAIYRHFEFYNDALKAAKATKQPLSNTSNNSENSSKPPEIGYSDPAASRSSGEADEPQPKQENEDSADDIIEDTSAGESAAQTACQQTITVQIVDNRNPLSGAHVTVGNTGCDGRKTDERGFVEIPIPENPDQVPVYITHQRWANKDLDIEAGDNANPYRLDVSQFDWNSGVPDEQSSSDIQDDSQDENESNDAVSSDDESTDMISQILQDIEQLDEV